MDQKTERNWALAGQLGGLLYIFFLNIIGPFVIWVLKKNESKFIDETGKEIINFEISMTVYGFVIMLTSLFAFGWFATAIVYWILPATNLTCVIMGAMKVSRGEVYQYPLSIKFIR